MKFPCFLSSLSVALLFSAAAAFSQTHPRLFFGPDDVAGLRAKAQTAPYSEMLTQMIKNIHSVDYNQRGTRSGPPLERRRDTF